jgi:hypothetical protein
MRRTVARASHESYAGLPSHSSLNRHLPPLQPAGKQRRLEQAPERHKALPMVQRARISRFLIKCTYQYKPQHIRAAARKQNAAPVRASFAAWHACLLDFF